MAEIKPEVVYDIVGTYFVKTFWTSLYDIAKEETSRLKTQSIADVYARTVDIYVSTVTKREAAEERTNKSYIAIVKDIYNDTKKYIPIGTITDFIDFVVKQFVHPDYYTVLSKQSQTKETLFRNILSKALGQFSIFVTTDELSVVLDLAERKKNWEKHMNNWQKKFIQILQNEKSELHKLFLAEKHGVRLANGQPVDMSEKLQSQIKSLNFTLQEKESLIQKQQKYIDFLKSTIKSRDATLSGIITQLKSLGVLNNNLAVNVPIQKSNPVSVAPNPIVSSSPVQVNQPQPPQPQPPQQAQEPPSPTSAITEIIEAECSEDEFDDDIEENKVDMVDITPPHVEIDVAENVEENNDHEFSSYEDLIPDD